MRFLARFRRPETEDDAFGSHSSDAPVVWNRACDFEYQPRKEGDRALRAALQLDSLTGNGGLGHAVDVMTEEEGRAAIAAFRHFGLEDTALLVEQAFALPTETMREALTDRYYDLTAGALETSLERRLAEHREEFEPVSSLDRRRYSPEDVS